MKKNRKKIIVAAFLGLIIPLTVSAKMFGKTMTQVGYSTMEGHCYGHFDVKKQFFWITTYSEREVYEIDCETGGIL